MRRLFSKIATLSVGLAMAIGVGVAIGVKQNVNVKTDAVVSDTAASSITSGKTYVIVANNYQVYDDGSSNRLAKLAQNANHDEEKAFTITLRKTVAAVDYYSVYSTNAERYIGWTSSTSFSNGNPANFDGDQYLWKITATNSTFVFAAKANLNYQWVFYSSNDVRPRNDDGTAFKLYEVIEKELNHIGVAATNPSGWYAGDTFRTTDVTVTPYYSEDDSDAGTPITDGAGVKFGDGANLDSVTLVQGSNAIKVNFGGKSTTLNVTAGATPVISGVVVSGDMTKKLYALNDDWDYTGLYITVSWTEGKSDTTVQFANLTIIANPAKANSTSIKSVVVSGTYEGNDFSKTVTGITVTATPISVTISGLGDSGTTQWKPTGNNDTFVDSAGNTATFNTDVAAAGISGTGSPMQFGKNASKGTYVLISIPLSARAGIVAASLNYSSNGQTTVESLIYGDTENDVILASSVTGDTAVTKSTTDDGVNYSTINASTIHFKITFTVGCKIGSFSYTLGDTVQEFDVFTSLAIQEATTDTQFKVGDTFSASGLVLRATDNVGFTKDFTTGFKFGNAEGDNSFTGHEFTSDDATVGAFTVYVTLTIGGITKSVNYGITVTEVPTYSLVSDLDDLYEGAKVLIVAGTKAAGVYGTNYLTATDVTFTGDDITDAGDALEFTIRIYGSKIAFQFGTYYLSCNLDNNQVQRSVNLDDACGFYNDGTGLVSNLEATTRYLQYGSALSPAGFACLKNGHSGASHVSIYISDKSVNTDTTAAETYAYRYLHMRDYTVGNGSCMTYYGTAKTKFGDLSAEQKAEFVKLTEAVERLQAWAEANGDAFDPDSKTFTKLFVENYVKGSSANYAIIIIVATVSITALGLTLMIVKKKKHD